MCYILSFPISEQQTNKQTKISAYKYQSNKQTGQKLQHIGIIHTSNFILNNIVANVCVARYNLQL